VGSSVSATDSSMHSTTASVTDSCTASVTVSCTRSSTRSCPIALYSSASERFIYVYQLQRNPYILEQTATFI
jgi:hypothetical protein